MAILYVSNARLAFLCFPLRDLRIRSYNCDIEEADYFFFEKNILKISKFSHFWKVYIIFLPNFIFRWICCFRPSCDMWSDFLYL